MNKLYYPYLSTLYKIMERFMLLMRDHNKAANIRNLAGRLNEFESKHENSAHP